MSHTRIRSENRKWKTANACHCRRINVRHIISDVRDWCKPSVAVWSDCDRGQLKCDGTRAETRFRLSAKRTSPFKSAVGGGMREASVQSTTGSRGVRISGSNAGYNMFRGSVKGTGYPLDSPFSPSLPLQCVTVYHHISTLLQLRFPQKVGIILNLIVAPYIS